MQSMFIHVGTSQVQAWEDVKSDMQRWGVKWNDRNSNIKRSDEKCLRYQREKSEVAGCWNWHIQKKITPTVVVVLQSNTYSIIKHSWAWLRIIFSFKCFLRFVSTSGSDSCSGLHCCLLASLLPVSSCRCQTFYSDQVTLSTCRAILIPT